MKIISLILILVLSISNNAQSQCYKVEADFGEMDNSDYQTALESAACQLKDSMPLIFQNQFKVFDFGFYSLNEQQEGGFKAVWESVKLDVALQSKFYLLFGKITNSEGIYTEFWVDLVLPRDNEFSCIDKISLNLRENLRKKYEIVANETHGLNGRNANKYHLAEIEVMRQLGEYIGGLKICCDYSKRSTSECSSCVLGNSQFERAIEKVGLRGVNVSKVIDNTHLGMGIEELGYTIESKGVTIDIDKSMIEFKGRVQSKFPNTNIKIFPFNYLKGCSNFDDIYNDFKQTDADIGIILGVTGVNGKSGKVWWQMISKDDKTIIQPTFNSDMCYYFDDKKMFSNASKCTSSGWPRGILKNLNGNNFDYEFSFADPIITPKTLTTDNIEDGQFTSYEPQPLEPLINKAILMKEGLIYELLSQGIKDDNGNYNYQQGTSAFDPQPFFAEWSLLFGSGGNNVPFDFSAKDFLLDRVNYLFITDDGTNIVGHNFRNMGNFLWGATTYIMGVPQWVALAGAHAQNMFGEFGLGGSDSPDDQYSIQLGRKFAQIRNWHTTYGGRSNIFKK